MATNAEIKILPEYEIPPSQSDQLAALLENCFPAFFDGRTYVKQLPHFRLLAIEGNAIIGQAGIDCRVINVGQKVLKIFGVLDVCVDPNRRGHGIATRILTRAEELAAQSSQDFLVLMADRHDLYLRNGYTRLQPAPTRWLAIENRASVQVIDRDLSDCFMIKPVGDVRWPSGTIDMLGYMF